MAVLQHRARRARATFAWLAFVPLVAGCGSGNLASLLTEAPSFEPSGQTKCQVQKSHDRPLIVEWPAAERADLETLARRGLIAVRYPGCDMRVLHQCRVSGRYAYAGITRKEERVAIRTADELYAAMPLSALRLESKLAKNGELDVAMTIVGKLEAPAGGDAPVLSGDCAGVTHLVTAITVGAFEFSSGAGADVGAEASFLAAGAGAKSSARRELLNRDGDAAACARSGASDAAPPDGCGAFLRLEVEPLTSRGAADASAPRSASPVESPPRAEPGPSPQATPIAATLASGGRPFAPGPSAGGGGALGPLVVARDGAGNLWLRDERPEAEAARAWRSLGRTATSATLVAGARPLVVARGADGTLAARPLGAASTGGAGDWHPLGPLGTDAQLAIALGPGGAASALGRALDGSLFELGLGAHAAASPIPGGPTPLGEPAAAYEADGALELFAIAGTGEGWHLRRSAGGNWQRWQNLGGGGLVGRMAVVRSDRDLLALFARSRDGALAHAWQLQPGGAFSKWLSLGGALAGEPVAFKNADGRLALVARGADGALWHLGQAQAHGTWGAWERLDASVAGDPAVYVDASGRATVLAVSPDGELRRLRQGTPGAAFGAAEPVPRPAP